MEVKWLSKCKRKANLKKLSLLTLILLGKKDRKRASKYNKMRMNKKKVHSSMLNLLINLKTKSSSKHNTDKQQIQLNKPVLSAVSMMKSSTKILWISTIGENAPC